MKNGEEPIGLTVNSFTSVSLDPPLVLACVARTSSSLETLEACENFIINVLHIDQEDISKVFSSRVEDRFSKIEWTQGQNGAPAIDTALAVIECSQHAVHDGGDHIILVGQVQRANYDSQKDPLLYFGGKYRRLHFV